MATRAGKRSEEAKAGGKGIANPQQILEAKLPELGEVKAKKKYYEEMEKPLVSDVKGLLSQLGKNKFEFGNWKCSVSETQNQTLNEERAIEILKEELASEPEMLAALVKTKEVLDQDELERQIYKDKNLGAMLATAIDVGKPTVTLRVTKVKQKF